jgi:hypothetical protein
MIVIASVNGLILLPVLLSVFGDSAVELSLDAHAANTAKKSNKVWRLFHAITDARACY